MWRWTWWLRYPWCWDCSCETKNLEVSFSMVALRAKWDIERRRRSEFRSGRLITFPRMITALMVLNNHLAQSLCNNFPLLIVFGKLLTNHCFFLAIRERIRRVRTFYFLCNSFLVRIGGFVIQYVPTAFLHREIISLPSSALTTPYAPPIQSNLCNFTSYPWLRPALDRAGPQLQARGGALFI